MVTEGRKIKKKLKNIQVAFTLKTATTRTTWNLRRRNPESLHAIHLCLTAAASTLRSVNVAMGKCWLTPTFLVQTCTSSANAPWLLAFTQRSDRSQSLQGPTVQIQDGVRSAKPPGEVQLPTTKNSTVCFGLDKEIQYWQIWHNQSAAEQAAAVHCVREHKSDSNRKLCAARLQTCERLQLVNCDCCRSRWLFIWSYRC